MIMSRFLSQKLRFFTFVCIALLVYVHGYNLKVGYLSPVSTVDEPLTFTTFFEYLFANGLLRFRIPMLFMISGFLYAWFDNRPYAERTKKRFTTLIIPYLIWSAIGLLVTFLLQQNPVTAKAVFDSQLDQLGDNRTYIEIGWAGIIKRWLIVPISFQLWFIFALFIYNVAYPGIRWMVLNIPYIWFPVSFLLWFTYFNIFFIEGQGLFYFSVGIWLQKKNISVERKPNWFAQGFFWILFIGICIIKTFMAFELEPGAASTFYTLWLLYNFASIAGILAVWYGADPLVTWCMNRKWFSKASSFSFFIYGFHIPLMAYLMKLAFMYLHNLPNYRLLCYLLVPAFTVLLSISLAELIRRIVPSVYRVMTGGRGL
jgi:fucose 4-O-acetylase-like acetyltransferase